jgi:cytochrome c
MIRLPLTVLAILLMVCGVRAAELRGHGGPVRGLAVSDNGATALSGSFDSTAIRWSLGTGSAEQVLRFHDGAVNAAVLLPDGRGATGDEDGRIAIWKAGATKPDQVLEGHEGPIVALSVSPDGRRLGSAAWDGTARVWSLDGEQPARILEGHTGNVNGIGFLASGEIATAGYDGTLRIWPASGPARVETFPTPLNALAVVPGGDRLAVGGADGRLRLVRADGTVEAEAEISPTPVIAVAADGRRIAASGLRGAIAILSADDLAPERTLVGPGLPVWSLAFVPGTDELLTGGNDNVIRRWDVATGASLDTGIAASPADPLAKYAGDPGAGVYRACVACHTLQPDEGVRAGPTLHGIMGRRIATLPDYDYSAAFASHDIVWTPETVARLFEIGPHAYTPGTKMPEQTINRAEDREALVRFLERATR